MSQFTDAASAVQNVEPQAPIRTEIPQAVEQACLLCGGGLTVTQSGLVDTRYGTPGTYEIRRCVQCALEQTYPVPSLAGLKELYEAQYNFGGETGTRYTNWRERFFFSFAHRLWIRLDGDISFHSKSGPGRLLDIGCNEGRGLRLYTRQGFQVEGLELNERAAAVARAGGFKVHTCLLNEFQPEVRYDVAVLSNVLEHSLEPRQMLLDIQRILADGGNLWISCPNSESWLRKVFDKSWINWHVPFHIFHFTSATLQQLLAETGYEQVEILQITPALWVAQSFIAKLFSHEGRKTRQLRSSFLVLIFMFFARFVFFPVLWIGNQLGRGDCLLAVATKKQ